MPTDSGTPASPASRRPGSGASAPADSGAAASLVIGSGVVAALTGGLLEGTGGFFLGGALGVAGALLWQQQRRLGRLEDLVGALTAQGSTRPAGTASPPPAQTEPPPVTPRATATPARAPVPPATSQAPEGAEGPDPAPGTLHAGGRGPGGVEGAARQVLDAALKFFTTGNLVVRLGVVVLFIGVALLLRYAYENALLPVEVRLIATTLGGVALTAAGWRLRARADTYGMVLQGAGVGVLYLTIFAAARLYDLLPLPAAFGALVVLVAASSLLAVMQGSQALAVLSMSGGFLAPVLMSTGTGSHVALFSYYALLNAGILVMAWFRYWRWLNWVGFLFTFVISATWGYRFYTPELFATTEPFLILFFVYYLGVSVLFARRQSPDLTGLVDGTLVFGTPIAAFALQWGLVRELPFGMAYSALAAALVYVLLAVMLYRRGSFSHLLGQSFIALSVVFVTLAVPFAFDDQRFTAATWALEGAGLIWVGLRQRQLLPRLAGMGLNLASGVAFAVEWQPGGDLAPLTNGDFLGAVLLATAGIFSARLLSREPAAIHRYEYPLRWLFLYWGIVWWVFAAALEILRFQPGWHEPFTAHNVHEHLALLTAAATAAVLVLLARRLGWREPLTPVLLLLPFSGLCLAMLDLGWRNRSPLADLGWLAWPAAAAALYACLAARDALIGTRSRRVSALWHAGTWWLLTVLAAWIAASPIIHLLEGDAWHMATRAAVPLAVAGALLWLARQPPERLRWPVAAHPASYTGWGLHGLLLVLVVWLVVSGLNAGDPAPLPYLVLINPLELTQLGVLLAAAVVLLRRPEGFDDAAGAALGLLGFLWLNLCAARAVHYYTGVAYPVEHIAASDVFQTTASILWTLIALLLMGLGTRHRRRASWISGAVLLAVVVVKLFVIDLSRLDMVARIVSFVSVGALMLVIGYFAPLPPARVETEQRA